MATDGGQPLGHNLLGESNNTQGTESANNLKCLKADPFPVESSDKNLVMLDTLSTTFIRDLEAKNPDELCPVTDPQKTVT